MIQKIMGIVAAFGLLPTLTGCGYTTRGLYPEHVDTVAVPVFKSKGLRRDIEFILTERVIKAIEAQTPYKVVSSGADTELVGVIESAVKTPYGEDGFDNPRGGIMNVAVSVTWVDNSSGKTLNESSQTFSLNTSTPYLLDLGQSQATATDKFCQEIADHIVSLMQSPW